MAEGEEKKEIVGGEEKSRQQFPPGFRFAPTNEELVEYYLLPRLQGRPHVPNDAIIDDYVYSCHPDDLILNGKYKDRGQDDIWYFLSSRARKYVNGDRPSRMTDDGRGRWKASTGSKSAVTAVSKVKYNYSGLGYHDGPIKEEDKGKWLMRELTVPEYEKKIDKNGGRSRSARDTLDEYVMCKIYMTKRKKKGYEAGPSGTSEEDTCPAAPQPWPVESSQDTAKPGRETAKPKHSAGRKGKRPVEAARPKQASPAPDQWLGPQAAGPCPTQLYGGGMQARFGATGYHHHYGGAGRPMAYNPHRSMPRPPVAFNGQVPPYQATPAAAPGLLGQAMMMRHLGLGGQAFRPTLPATVPRYPAMQRQPETEEMREMRVYQQHINEMMMRGMMQQQQPGNAAYAAQQPRPMAFMQQHQQQQQPYFGAGGVNHYPVRPMGLQHLPCNYLQPVEEVGQQVQCSSAVSDSGAAAAMPAETGAGCVGATNEGADVGGDCKNDEEKGSVEAATKKVLPDGTTAPADGGDTEEDPPY